MCIICVMFDQDKLSRYEVSQALREMVRTETIDTEHAVEIYEKLANDFEKEKEDKDDLEGRT